VDVQLSRVPDFQGISRAEFEALLEPPGEARLSLRVREGSTRWATRPRRLFGRKNFQELYAVFSAPLMYRVLAGAQEIGSIEPTFVERLVEGMSSFLLGGRAWVVDHVVHADREVHVRAAPGWEEANLGRLHAAVSRS
jgi:ATP-dependent Lhr-like helicase